ncbi:TIGR04282 family arsenosugar biosynthesis glycosyltransferase [Sedimentitalea todarodis]|uniref:TIGR04282 family arsenosugar biosynthesis glycosyltransferase n=1 Tax=Sedimentitalea todarodis TaxID=1631240 RepID=A0ABU3VDK0_9RHOB|nr:TIGR04282 family arsenosugar biosynthesis glycosyltransferase [Sedimentitalea todarodis]MDU9004239.1 TIGR04282 family arsenosugar biosynthesis glycosyltransferase [Sedimentitalea todarodis]
MSRTVVVMLKEPRPGRVKTRLGCEIGMGPAARWFRLQALSLLRRIRDPRWNVVLAVTPDREGLQSRLWPVDLPRIPQGYGDLGARMTRALRAAAPGPVSVIGADVPGLGTPQIAAAFAALGNHHAVFGPASDGGFWLVGLKHPLQAPKGLFRGVRWSTEHALTDSRATLGSLTVAQIETLHDVDTAADLRRIG